MTVTLDPAVAYRERAKVEETFHDAWAKSMRLEELLVRESFESPTAVENRYALEAFGGSHALRGKQLLDLGCGAGETAVFFALQGAEVTAVDISAEMLLVAQRLAQHHGVRLSTLKMMAEAMTFPDASFDFIYGNGVLHHVELAPALNEIARILKAGGRAAFVEPLSHNPVIEVYRRIAQGVRTPTEQPFTFEQLAMVRERFAAFRHQEFWLSSLAIFLYYYFIERVNPEQDRYWKRVIRDGPRVARAFHILHGIDRAVLRVIPWLRRWCWNTVMVVKR